MKGRGQTLAGGGFDGFDRSVAEKMPKTRREEDSSSAILQEEVPLIHEAQETKLPEKVVEGKANLGPPPMEGEGEENLEISKLVEDLHTQLLVSNRTKTALEMDLISSQKTIQQLARENKALGVQLEGLKKELQKLGEVQSEVAYLEEENEDALERITGLQEETRSLKEILVRATLERDQALAQIQVLEAKIEQSDLSRIKERLKEREAYHLSEENEGLRRRLEEALRQNMDLEKKYEVLKKSFHEVKESLTLLRDACKTSYYNLSGGSE